MNSEDKNNIGLAFIVVYLLILTSVAVIVGKIEAVQALMVVCHAQ